VKSLNIRTLTDNTRYHELLFMIDTCQANTMYSKFYSPNIIATGSSAIDESSYSHHADSDVGVAVIDRWTYYILEFLETQVLDQNSKKTLGDLFDSYDESKIHSQPGLLWDLFPGGEPAGRERMVMDFFGNVQNVEIDGAGGQQFNVTAWKEDLADIQRLISAMKAANETGSISTAEVHDQQAEVPVVTTEALNAKDFGEPGLLKGGDGLSKQAIGTAVIIGGLGFWLAGSMLGSVK